MTIIYDKNYSPKAKLEGQAESCFLDAIKALDKIVLWHYYVSKLSGISSGTRYRVTSDFCYTFINPDIVIYFCKDDFIIFGDDPLQNATAPYMRTVTCVQ